MVRVAYLVVALAALAPAALIAAASLYVITQTEAIETEGDRASGETLHFYGLSIGGFDVPIHPRRWAAV